MSGPKFQRGDIIHTRSPHADGGESRHWALIVGDPLCNKHGDYVVIQITSTPYYGASDYILKDTDPEFSQTGLQNSSTFRCHKLFPVSENQAQKKLGDVGPNTMATIENHLRRVLQL